MTVPITNPQIEEHILRFAKPLRDHGITKHEYGLLREDQAYKYLASQFRLLCRRIEERRNPLGFSLPLNTLEGQRYVPANLDLFYEWDRRLSEEERYERVKAYFRTHLDITAFDLVKSGSQSLPGWPLVLVISPVDLALHLGVDIFGAEKQQSKAYCDLARLITLEIPSLKKSNEIHNDLGRGGARLEVNTCQQWQSLPDQQLKGQPLKVRRMSVNPATWFGFDNAQYSISPMEARTLVNHLPTNSKARRAACGDLVVFSSLVLGEPHLLDQIADSAGPKIDIPGTELDAGLDWSRCPRCNQGSVESWLDSYSAAFADGCNGSLLVALE